MLTLLLPRFSLGSLWKGMLICSLLFALGTAIAFDIARANSFATYAHVPALLVGSALATYLADGQPSPCRSKWLALVFGYFLAALSIKLTPAMPAVYNGGLLAADIAAAMVIAHCLASDSFVTRLLQSPILVGVGTISYGLYVYHFPTFLLLEQFRIPHDNVNFVLLTACRFGLTFAVAIASYHWLEKPFLRLKLRWSVVQLSAAAGLAPPVE